MNKKKVTLDYISHTQNTSPAKLSFSFSKTVRFPQNISYILFIIKSITSKVLWKTRSQIQESNFIRLWKQINDRE